jgi:hypothetical protein
MRAVQAKLSPSDERRCDPSSPPIADLARIDISSLPRTARNSSKRHC